MTVTLQAGHLKVPEDLAKASWEHKRGAQSTQVGFLLRAGISLPSKAGISSAQEKKREVMAPPRFFNDLRVGADDNCVPTVRIWVRRRIDLE